jgi:hypothetical protein
MASESVRVGGQCVLVRHYGQQHQVSRARPAAAAQGGWDHEMLTRGRAAIPPESRRDHDPAAGREGETAARSDDGMTGAIGPALTGRFRKGGSGIADGGPE